MPDTKFSIDDLKHLLWLKNSNPSRKILMLINHSGAYYSRIKWHNQTL